MEQFSKYYGINAAVETWDEVALGYPESPSAAEISLAHEILEVLSSNGFNNDTSLLEVGSGSGHLSLTLCQAGFLTDLLDFSTNALDHSREVYARAKLVDRANFWEADALSLEPSTLPKYDIAWNSGVAEHFDTDTLVTLLKNMAATAKHVLIIVPNPESVFYLAGKRRLLEAASWPYGTELHRGDYERVLALAGLQTIKRGYLGRSLTTDWITNAVGPADDGLFSRLLNEGQIPKREYYLQYFLAEHGVSEETVKVNDELTLDKTFYLDAMGTATALIARLKNDLYQAHLAAEGKSPVEPSLAPEFVKLRDEVTSAKAQIAEARAETVVWMRYSMGMRDALREMRASRSWKITKPLRTAIRVLKRIPNRDLTLPPLPEQVQNSGHAGDERAKRLSEFAAIIEKRRMRGGGVFVQSPICDFHFIMQQRPHHLARELARLGVTVVYLSPKTGWDDISGYAEVEPNLFVTDMTDFLHVVSGASISVYAGAPTLTLEDLQELQKRGNKIIYEYADHFDEQIAGEGARPAIERHRRISEDTVTWVVPTAQILKDEMVERFGSEKVLLVPNGVDVTHFDISKHLGKPAPDKIAKIVSQGKPIVGYFGAIAPWLWFDLIEKIAKARPDYSFVYIGPDYNIQGRKFPTAPNIYRTGPINYADLPDYTRFFDVGIIPFQLGELAKSTSPLKLFEYLAAGKPVVVTRDMRECAKYSSVFVADDPSTFSLKIDDALNASKDETFIKQAREIAEENSWGRRAEALLPIIRELA